MKASKLRIKKEVFYSTTHKKGLGYYVKISANSNYLKEYGPYSMKEIAEGVAKCLG